jgi:phosphoribosyl 1,2-cyclic phosphodiesterase
MDIKVLASGSSGNCYYVSDGDSPILIECGIAWKQIQQGINFRTSELAGVLVSHEHQDHCKAFKDVMKAGIDCYMSKGTAEVLNVSGHRLHIIKGLQQFQLGGWTVLPFDVQHDAKEPLGFLLANKAGDKLLYATDTYYLKYKFRGLTHILVECNYALDILQENVAAGLVPAAVKNRVLRSHFSLENVKGFLRANDLRQTEEIWLLHLSDGNSDAERFKREIQKATGKMVCVAGTT